MKHLHTAIQGFGAGSIVMAYVSNYNRSQLPLATILLVMSILFRLGSK